MIAKANGFFFGNTFYEACLYNALLHIMSIYNTF